MLDFKNKLEKTIVDYFIKYNVNPHPVNDGKIVIFDPENQIHYTNSIVSASNLNIGVSKNLINQKQYDKALEIIKTFQTNRLPFTWCIVSNTKALKEKDFFLKHNFVFSETVVTMVFELENFNNEINLKTNEAIKVVETLDDVEKFRGIIKSAFSLSLIDLQKYYGLYELRKNQKFDYQAYLTVNDLPVVSGHFYFEEEFVIIDDIATKPNFQEQGLAKKMINHLLNTAKALGFKKATLLASEKGFGLYQKIGFQPINLYFDVYEINY